MNGIETDYLVIGAGAAGMAFIDALIADCDADVVMVDRRSRPGGHWNDAYPFVRLHQPSAFYGVNSRRLGHATRSTQTGPNAGFYERATAAEICDYFQQVLDEHLLPSGQVRFFGMSDYVAAGRGEHALRVPADGETTTVRVRRKVVDATYLETSIPATHVPSFDVDAGRPLIPVNDLVDRLDIPASGFTVIGAGKTAMDACLLAARQRAWTPTRSGGSGRGMPGCSTGRFQQPLDLVPTPDGERLALPRGRGAGRRTSSDLFRRLEACGQLLRLDPRCRADDVPVRDGERGRAGAPAAHPQRRASRPRVTHIGADRIELGGRIDPDGPRAGPRRLLGGRAARRARSRDLRPMARSRCSRSGLVSRSSAPPWPATRRQPAATTRRRTCSARPTRIRSRPWTGFRSPASPSARRWRGSPIRTCRPRCNDHGSMPAAGSATISTTR